MRHKIVVFDGHTLNPGDLDWSPLEQLGDLKVYDRTIPTKIYARGQHATIAIVNKTKLDMYYLGRLRKLQFVCVSATGYNNVDTQFAKELRIPVSNVVGYSSPSVAQHVFAMILNFTNQVAQHNQAVQAGAWENAEDWCFWNNPLMELNNKTIGIYGLGKIGKQVAQIAVAFGMRVIALHKHPKRDAHPQIEFVSQEKLFKESDFLTLHAPLNLNNQDFINTKSLKLMKSSAILINTGRGGLVNEIDLKKALETNQIAGAALDVLSQEPPSKGNVLIGTKNCIITPHQAWGSRASRQRLLDGVVANVKAFISRKTINVVNK